MTLTQAIKVKKKTSVNLLISRITQLLKNKLTLYNLEPQAIDLFIMGRPWLSEADFNVPMNLINEVLEKNLNTDIDINSFYLNKFDTSGSNKKEKIKKYLYDNIYFGRYGEPISEPSTKDIIGYKLNKNEHAMVHKFIDNKNQKCFKVDITEFNFDTNAFGKEVVLSWLDTETEDGFTRELEGIKYFNNKENQVFNVEKKYNFYSFPLQNKSKILNTKIGTIDLETFGSNSGLGYHQVYAGGWAIKNKTQLFYLKPKETGEHLINRIFLNILTQKELNGYTFYVHNLGRFDSIFIIRSLVSNKNFKLTPIWKDTGILTITIEYGKNKIVLLDSYQLIKGSLKSILISFNCDIKKIQFPYDFVNQKNLYYIGDKPSKNFFKSISDSDYYNIANSNWDLKRETLNYLKSDLEGLLEAVLIFNKTIFERYHLNITRFKTLPSLALGVYSSEYLPEGSKIKMIKGELEKEIRSSYFGGNVDVFINKISEGYYYDMNSQYPTAMLNDMPVGDPVFSLETELNKIFGFVYGEISCPDENILKVPFIQDKDPDTNLNVCPRGKFKRLIF